MITYMVIANSRRRVGLPRRVTFGVVLVAILLLALALIVIVLPGRQNLSTVTSSSSTVTSSSSTISRLGLIISLAPPYRLLSPGMSDTFTLNLFGNSGLNQKVEVSADPPDGVTVSFSPSSVVLGGGSGASDLNVSVRPDTTPGPYSITIQLRSSVGVSNQTFAFQVLKHLVRISGGSNQFVPLKITVKPGESVTWIDLASISEEADPGFRGVVFENISASSGQMGRYETWTFTFTHAGVYTYHELTYPVVTGVVNVVA